MKGNEAVKQQQWAEALSLYSEAIQTASTNDDSQLARLNRSLVNLKLGHFEDALADASNQNEISLEKSLFRQARALYELRRYQECLDKMEEASRLYPNNNAIGHQLTRARDRVKEANTGDYSFARMYKQAKRPEPIIDCATFSKPVEILPSPGRGRGLFVSRDVKVGDLLLCEKAFAYCFADPENKEMPSKTTFLMQQGSKVGYLGGQAQMIRDIVQKLQYNPECSRSFLGLHPGDYQSATVCEVDGHPVVDTFRVMKTVTANCFGAPRTSADSIHGKPRESDEEKSVHSTCGIWAIASHINHSCIGNCRRSFIGDMMVIRATQDLPMGTELVMPYKLADPFSSYEERQKQMQNWGFVCDCRVCVNKRETPRHVLEQRKSLHRQLQRHLQPAKAIGPNMGHVTSAARVLQQIDAAYASTIKPHEGKSHKLFTPRLASWDPYFALGAILVELGKPEDAVQMTVKGLEALGFEVTAPPVRVKQKTGSVAVLEVKSWGMTMECLHLSFSTLFRAYRDNDLASATAAKKYFMISHAICIGESETALEIFPELK